MKYSNRLYFFKLNLIYYSSSFNCYSINWYKKTIKQQPKLQVKDLLFIKYWRNSELYIVEENKIE